MNDAVQVANSTSQRNRGSALTDSIVLEVRNLQKHFTLKTGLFSQQQLIAVDDVSFRLATRQNIRHCR